MARQTAEQLITAGVVGRGNEIRFPSHYLGRYQTGDVRGESMKVRRKNGVAIFKASLLKI